MICLVIARNIKNSTPEVEHPDDQIINSILLDGNHSDVDDNDHLYNSYIIKKASFSDNIVPHQSFDEFMARKDSMGLDKVRTISVA